MAFDDIAWLPLSLGLTALGLAAAVGVARRRGLVPAARVVAWALIPLALYLVGAVRLVWRVGVELTRFVTRFGFSPSVWLGLVLLGASAALFAVTGFARRRALGRSGDAAPRSASVRARPRRPAESGDIDDVEEILRRRGIL